jgi:hypothetical protein
MIDDCPTFRHVFRFPSTAQRTAHNNIPQPVFRQLPEQLPLPSPGAAGILLSNLKERGQPEAGANPARPRHCERLAHDGRPDIPEATGPHAREGG